MKILIAGDSFAAQWPNATKGWVNLLAEKYHVTNIAQAGVGEYKILKQIQFQNIKEFDVVIVSHTSPSRVHTRNHPLHKEGFHKDCDLIITDLVDRNNIFDDNLKTAKGWFKHHYDENYQIDIYNLLRKEINSLISVPYISMTHVDIATELAMEDCNLDFSELWKTERGNINHYTEKGNKLIFKTVEEYIAND
jgi:hypothetical protein